MTATLEPDVMPGHVFTSPCASNEHVVWMVLGDGPQQHTMAILVLKGLEDVGGSLWTSGEVYEALTKNFDMYRKRTLLVASPEGDRR